ncbi:M1 family metallopeptidase [Ferruginibacter sp. SUN002]|uniref:M1 family metallopeptidase n=1 Tax=Ferruginibacter sp. SUN002 TaxID=2937789 RepID=UPI003D36CFBF
MKKYLLLITYNLLLTTALTAQSGYWQQAVNYKMNIDVNVVSNKFTGKQELVYTNNSPDTLKRVFYHLYYNAFQPNSSLDIRSQELGKQLINGRQDWDGRVRDRVSKLKDDEIGYQKIISLKMNGVSQTYVYHETILEVKLSKPILPKSKVTFVMDFEAQIPVQIRRTGRDNPNTGVRYSMSQWYPKMCEYDNEGWHPTPYIAREFYGVWGNYDVTINIDKTYKLGGTGVLANAEEIGWGYDLANTKNLKPTSKAKRSWHFVGNNVHDFVWAADPDYVHIVRKTGSTVLNVIYNYKENDTYNDSAWTTVADAAVKVLPFIEKTFGKYPYPQYSFIQGGDGGMEYPMATLLNGPGLDAVFHEWMHSWFQMILGTNESMYAWMDEGFTSFAENLVTQFYNNGRSSIEDYKAALVQNPDNKGLRDLVAQLPNDHCDGYAGYFQLAKSGYEEPLTTHADHFNSNYAYSIASYSKGEVFMEQLGYIVGAATRDKILLEYYNKWKFKHPNAQDFIRVAENVSDIKLDWYKEYWCNTTKTINYSIDSLWEENGMSKIRIKRIGQMPMPIDLQLTFKDGTTEMHYIPLNMMYGEKENEDKTQVRIVHPEWRWTHPTYIVEFKQKLMSVKKVEIDPSKRMADVERKNNVMDLKW